MSDPCIFMNFFSICHKNVIKSHFFKIYHTVKRPKIKAFPTLLRNYTRFKVIKQRLFSVYFLYVPICSNLCYTKIAVEPPAERRCTFHGRNTRHTSCLRDSKRSQLLHMQMAERQTIGSNSLNGIAHLNEQESPQSCSSGGFRFLLHGISSHSLAVIIICYC